MIRRLLARPFGLVLAALLLGSNPVWAAKDDAPSKKKTVYEDILYKGDARCTRCHSDVNGGEIDNYPVLPIGRTKHGTVADKRTPTCVSCHGDSEKHLKQDGEFRPLPDMPFGKKVMKDPARHNQACLECHEGGKLMHWGGSIHARRDAPCTSCHQMHQAHDPATTREKVADMCMSCHKEKRAQFARPNHHPVPEGKMVCTDCHNPHGSTGPKLMVKESVNETCYACHMEYRGPFLWSHLPVTQDCTICHNPHGTTTAGMLKLRAPFLCQQCHEPTSHRGNFPGLYGEVRTGPPTAVNNPNYNNSNFPDSGGLTQARGCVNCHTNIHGGSNSTNLPPGQTNQRSFRR